MAEYGIPSGKIRVVLNRTMGSPRQPALDEIVPARLAEPAIVTVAGMNRRKGIEELISSFEIVGEQFKDVHLYLVGDGPEREQFKRQACRSKWSDRIRFEGFQAVPQAYMLSADVFVLASRRESFALVLIEARQAGCAIVATDVDGASEALDGGRAGILIPPRNVPALASALCRLVGNDDERKQWQYKARQGLANYRVQVMASEVRSVYDEVVEGDALSVASNIA
jgi:glycosyltransferase involved in cell wall biosynthesis